MKWTIKECYEGMLIRDYLQQVHGFSRRIIKGIKFDGGKITVNGAVQTVRYPLVVGDVLEVSFPPEKIGSTMEPEDMNLTIVYEDDAIIVIDKPAGMATIPSFNHPTGTVANGVLGHYQKNRIPYTIHVVTRLDLDTSGLVLIAKYGHSHSLLSASQKAGKVRRKYVAMIEGNIGGMKGTIDAPIDRKEGSIIERAVKETGKRAVTHYKVIKESHDHALLEIKLETGRTHQIRVHFSHISHPLAGDDLYGGSKNLIDRQALHCCEICFEHPFTGEVIQLQSPLPKDIVEII